ncbi:hypothetical protein EDD11_010079 [Mortierella claussenii]|nr:hypothetical protein EDD11_010079 [Mortierella claussenii]
MPTPPPRKNPILPPDIDTPANPSPSAHHAALPHAGDVGHTSTSDIGVLKLSGQVSQNDERLPQQFTLPHRQQAGSESGGSGPQNVSISETPYLDESPASNQVGYQYTQGSSSSAPVARDAKHVVYDRYQSSESQSLEIISASRPEGTSEGTETSFSHSHSSHHSSFSHSISDESGSNRTNSSFGNTSGSLNSRSSDSQASDMSFTQAETSTPRRTPIRTVASQKSTPSDSDQHSSPSSQISPTRPVSVQRYTSRVIHTETYQQEISSTPARAFQPIPEDEPLVIQGGTQHTEDFGTDPSPTQVQEAFAEELEPQVDPNATQDYYVSSSVQDEGDGLGESLTAEEILKTAGLTPPVLRTRKRGDRKHKGQSTSVSVDSSGANFENISSDEDEASRSMLDNKLDLNISQSIANIGHSLSLTAQRLSSAQFGSLTSAAPSIAATSKVKASTVISASITSTSTAAVEDIPAQAEVEVGHGDSLESVRETQDMPDLASQRGTEPSLPTTGHSTPVRSQPATEAESIRPVRSHRSPRRLSPSSHELPSSQSSTTLLPSPSAFVQRLQSAAAADPASEHLFPAVSKRRRTKPVETNALQVVSSMGDEDFWEGTDRRAAAFSDQGSQSESQDVLLVSQDIPFEQEDIEDLFPMGSQVGNESQSEEEGPPSPTKRINRARAATPPKRSSTPPTSQSRELRRRGASQASGSAPGTPTRRTLRRLHSSIDALRAYKVRDAVWARWRKLYYAGEVIRKDADGYHVHFLDDDIASCEGTQMRPLKLRLGAEVLAMKPDAMDYPARIEGIHLDPMRLLQSNVDVRFGDDSEAHLPLRDIMLTMEMMEELDKDMDWDEEATRQQSLPSLPEASTLSRQSSSTSAPPGTPRKNRSHLERHTSGSPTSSRRNKSDPFLTSGPSTPSRRGKDFFRDLMFVLSLSSPTAANIVDREIVNKIRQGGGLVLDDFTSVLGTPRAPPANLLFISFKAVRTTKYLEALALNVPRLSYHWIEACTEARQLLPYQSYLLPTGFSNELDTVVSSVPHHDRGIFDGLKIGMCGPSQTKKTLESILKAAGATVVKVTAKSGPLDCNYILFSCLKSHQQYCEANTSVPSLSDEWVIQCLINQRVVAVNGHPSYTDLEKKTNNGSVPGSTASTPGATA